MIALGKGIVDFLETVLTKEPDLVVVCSTVDREDWSEQLYHLKGVKVAEKPLGVWSIHAALRSLLPFAATSVTMPDDESKEADAIELDPSRPRKRRATQSGPM